MLPNEDAIRAVLFEVQTNSDELKKLLETPDVIFSRSGVAVPSESARELSQFLAKHIASKTGSKFTAKKTPTSRCVICSVSVWGIAAGIVAIGSAALSTLTTASPIVVSLASWAGVAPQVALSFIASLGKSLGAGVASVASKICTWAGYCP